MMGDPLGNSARVSSQKQNREGMVGAQSGQYRATMDSSPGCGGVPGRDVTDVICICEELEAVKNIIKKLRNFN